MLPHRAFLGVTGPGMGLGTGETPGQRPGQPSDRRSDPRLDLNSYVLSLGVSLRNSSRPTTPCYLLLLHRHLLGRVTQLDLGVFRGTGQRSGVRLGEDGIFRTTALGKAFQREEPVADKPVCQKGRHHFHFFRVHLDKDRPKDVGHLGVPSRALDDTMFRGHQSGVRIHDHSKFRTIDVGR